MYQCGNKRQGETFIGTGKVSVNPATGEPQAFREKECKFCKEVFTPVAPSHLYCSQDCADNGFTEGYVKRTYGLTFCQWVDMFEYSSGMCYICGSRGFKLQEKNFLKLAIDHDHKTGEVRGLLCHNCNRALGLMQDNVLTVKKAVEYLESATTISKESTLK